MARLKPRPSESARRLLQCRPTVVIRPQSLRLLPRRDIFFSMEKVNLQQKFASFRDTWSPKIAGQVNDCLVKLVKLEGEFVWHHHEHEDEMFLVVKGALRMQVRENGGEREIVIGEGEFLVVPRGVEHLPIADQEAHVLLFEPKETLNTGNLRNERTVEKLEKV